MVPAVLRIHMFLGLLDPYPDPSVRGMDPDLDPRIHAWLMDPDPDADPDPTIFVIDLPKMAKKINILNSFFCLLSYFLKVHVHNFQR
jgi:hypothetical protein